MTTNYSSSAAINDKNLEQCVFVFLEKIDSIEKTKNETTEKHQQQLPFKNELRTLHLWRSVIAECLASFFYVFIVCGAASTSASAGSFLQTANVAAVASGFTVCVITYCFQNLSGAHINPAISIPMVVRRNITPLRGLLFVAAQCGGAIAGAALLYGITAPNHYGNLNATISQILPMNSPWERFSAEFVLTFLIVFTYCVTMNGLGKWLGNRAIFMGLAYLCTGLVSMPTQNPIRAFGPAFVTNRWEYHWVFWFGPCMGGLIAALVYEIIFIAHHKKNRSDMSVDGDSASSCSEVNPYDDVDKDRSMVQRVMNPNPYTRHIPQSNGYDTSYSSGGFYPMSIYKTEHSEPIYEGSRSMYTRSPLLTRTNLNRSQSVYAKTTPNNTIQRREFPRTGAPPYPAQSMYPTLPFGMNTVNQNHQNQIRQGAGDSMCDMKMDSGSRNMRGKIPGHHEYTCNSGTKKLNSSDNDYNNYIHNCSGGSNKSGFSKNVVKER